MAYGSDADLSFRCNTLGKALGSKLESRFACSATPAENISVLLEMFREREPYATATACYRGQVRDYGNLMSSKMRTRVDLVSAEPRLGRWRDVGSLEGVQQRREIERSIALRHLEQEFGPSVGNILGQQYGLTSDTVDVTDDVNTAAFFATRSYPSCEHFEGSESAPIGVIYRIPHYLEWGVANASLLHRIEDLVRLHNGALQTEYAYVTGAFDRMTRGNGDGLRPESVYSSVAKAFYVPRRRSRR